ncbi:L-threonine aldolase [Prevotella aff. ruminicola Tc2-24]|uniref:L-threonine aldolase n=1 Tax=Prevotella aff. ruminicola Tc2-24 TaxID=81582 RepID=A0A1I0QKQ9_9BACT|nr:beta-eliminating lyase-related protein [Prevotella aff. ruminicola Tc2-24]SEW27659.1 L-threonine aldolase [Prevotella aff. ruminicola Tc2-24]
MISFECDYNNGAHEKVLENLIKNNGAKPTPYGFDTFCERAKNRIREACGMPDAQIFFLTGGTQTNATTIDSMLYQYEGVICVGTGHINVHEAGAVEFTEHKIITLPDTQGKMEAKVLDKYLDDYMHDGNKDHAVHPGLVYITFPTEFGTLYSARELNDIYQVCQHYEIPLYIDGARLGYGLAAEGNDITLPYLARHCDVFYIGGTKIGALCGEAVVFTHQNAHKHFFSIQKQHGAVIAKGALIGLQFEALFSPLSEQSDEILYFKLSAHAIRMAMRMKDIFIRNGYEFYVDSPTNQQFVIIDNEQVDRLSCKMLFTHFGQADKHHTICRFVTSWATTEEEINELEKILESEK